MDAEDTQHDPLRDAREAALRRIDELRQRSARRRASPQARTCVRCWRARSGTSTNCGARRASSPRSSRRAWRPRSHAPWARTRAASAAGSTWCVDRTGQLAAAIERVEGDLLAERMARVEDLEVLVELVSGGLTALRADLRSVRRELAELQAVVGQPLHFTVAREQSARAGGAAPAVRVRASVEDAPASAAPQVHPTHPDTPRHTRD